jgi:hypothetical protein
MIKTLIIVIIIIIIITTIIIIIIINNAAPVLPLPVSCQPCYIHPPILSITHISPSKLPNSLKFVLLFPNFISAHEVEKKQTDLGHFG